MQSAKITHYLRLLATKEWPTFHDFLTSPYFNKSPDALRLFEVIRDHLLAQPEKNLSEEETALLIWPGQPFPRIKFRKLKSALLDLFLHFLAQEGLALEPGRKEILLLDQLIERQESRFFHQVYQDALQVVQTEERKGVIHFRNLFEIQREWARNGSTLAGRPEIEPLAQSLEALEKSFRLEKLMLGHALREIELVTGSSSQVEGMEAILNWVDQHPGLEPIFPVMACLYRMASQPQKDENFFRLTALLQQFSGQFSHSEAMDMYSGALNFCWRRINKGEEKWLAEVLALYQRLLETELLLENGKIHFLTFKNIVVAAALNDAWDWLESLLQDFKKRIQGDNHENALLYGKAILHFGRNEWPEAEKQLNLILQKVDDLFFGLDARNLLLKVYYETGNPVGMDSLLNSFRVYLDRHEHLSKAHKAHYHAFIRLFRRLINTPPHQKIRMQKLKRDIQVGKVSDRRWLKAKLDKLKT
ncbi:MAG: hypothetical protein H6581_22820 [Bacteroidia bacterium]|nr:hypothetical protein [Bacteroidia bacterium]